MPVRLPGRLEWLPHRIVQRCSRALAEIAEPSCADVRDLHLLPLGISPDRQSGASLYHQIHEGLRSAILDGRLASGVRLPSTRAAAAELGVARNTMVAVFEQLAAEGFVRSRVGDGTRVADIEPELLFRPARRTAKPSGSARERGAGQRLVAVTECSLERELARFETDYRFASRQKLDDMWVVLDLVNDLAETRAVRGIKMALGRRYRRSGMRAYGRTVSETVLMARQRLKWQ